MTLDQKIHWAKEYFFHINKELTDLINCLPHWKMHYKNTEKSQELVSSNLIEEYVDVLKYLMGLGQVLGISYEDVIKGYKDKTEVVKQKYHQNKQFKKIEDTQVVVFDIDGVINNFPICFLDWIRSKKQIDFETVEELKSSIHLQQYEELKTEYRLSGEKRRLPVNQETLSLMRQLKKQGETIILFTNRPVSKYKIIATDTLYWLRTNKIPFEAIYWSDFERKEDIYRLKFRIKFIVEDSLDNAKNFNREGHRVFLLDKSYNQDSNYKSDLLIRIKTPAEIYDLQKKFA